MKRAKKLILRMSDGEEIDIDCNNFHVEIDIQNGIDSGEIGIGQIGSKLNGRKKITILLESHPQMPLDGEMDHFEYKFKQRGDKSS